MGHDPNQILLADEPTGNLDTSTATELFVLFENLMAQRKTLVVVTHDQSLSARVERVLYLLDGRINRNENNGKWTR